MAGDRMQQRRSSMDLLILFQNFREQSNSFISLLDDHEARVTIILQELRETSDKLKELHRKTDETSSRGRAFEAASLILALSAVATLAFTEVNKYIKLGLGSLAVLGSHHLTKSGCKTGYDANSEMLVKEREIMEAVDQLCEEFKDIIQQLKSALREVHNVQQEINERSGNVETTGTQAEKSLSEIDKFLQIPQQMDELDEHHRAELIHKKLVSQCEKTFEELKKMRNELRDFQ